MGNLDGNTNIQPKIKKSIRSSFILFIFLTLTLWLVSFVTTTVILGPVWRLLSINENTINGLSFFLFIMLYDILMSYAFYQRNLKRPLSILTTSFDKIANGDLDFKISYPNKGELGYLCNLLETMRNTLEKTEAFTISNEESKIPTSKVQQTLLRSFIYYALASFFLIIFTIAFAIVLGEYLQPYLFVNGAVFSFFISILLIIVIPILMGFLFYNRRIRKPLTLLIKNTQRISAGILTSEIRYPINDEIGLVCQSMEHMRDALYRKKMASGNKIKDFYEDNSMQESLIPDNKTGTRGSIRKSFALFVSMSLILIFIFLGMSFAFIGYINQFFSLDQSLISFILLVIFCILLSVLMSYLFFNRKLKDPIDLIVKSSDRIAHHDLDFKIYYPSDDEMGLLCDAMEKMRRALYNNNIKMWRMTEERKEVNNAFSHDLRTPITVLKGYVNYLDEYLKTEAPSKEKLAKTLRVMSKNVAKIENYVEMMNTIQKLEDTPVKKEQVSTLSFWDTIKDNGNKLSKRYGKELEIQDTLSLHINTVYLDPDVVSRVMDNILINGFLYANTRVKVTAFIDTDILYIVVRDDGQGFSESDLRKVFEPFYQGENSKGTFGMGLSICQLLCQKHNGKIILENNPIIGAKVTLSFSLNKTF